MGGGGVEGVGRHSLALALLPLPGLDVVFLQFYGSLLPMHLVVETTCIADRSPLLVPPPQGGGAGAAVGADQVSCLLAGSMGPGGVVFEDGSVVPIHFVIQSTRIAQVVSFINKDVKLVKDSYFVNLPLVSLLQRGVLLDPQLTHCLISTV